MLTVRVQQKTILLMKTNTIYIDVVSAIIACGISWWVFSVATNRFEVIVISGLVYIYANSVFLRSGLSSIVSTNSKMLLEAILRIKPDDDDLIAASKELENQSSSSLPKYIVATGKFVILELIVLWKLIEEFILK